MTPTIRFSNLPFRAWLTRIDVDDPNLFNALDWIDRVNGAIFRRFDADYDG